MKKTLIILLTIAILLIFVVPLSACSNRIDGKIAFATDLHIIANSLINSDNYAELSNEDKMVHLTDAITNTMADNLKKQGIKVLLIGGDITEDGDEESHIKAAQIFRRIEEKGIKVLVINGNHDVAQDDNDKEISSKRFSEIYSEFGYDEALSKYNSVLEGTLSYTADIDKYSRLIAIDDIVHTEFDAAGNAKDYNKPDSLSNEHIDWIIEQVKECIKDGKKPIVMTHISLMNHFPQVAQIVFDKGDHFQYNKLLELLADNGAKYILAGHYHFQDCAEYVSSKGNKLYEVETASFSFYPCAYRQIDINKKNIETYTRYIDEIDEKYLPSSITAKDKEQILNNFPEYCRQSFDNELERMIDYYISLNGPVGEEIDDIDNLVSKEVVTELFSVVDDAVNSPFYIKDENNNVSLERILKNYDIKIGKTDCTNLKELLPKMAEYLFYGNENLEDSDEIQLINYSLLSIFYHLDAKSDSIYNLNKNYPKLNIDLEDLFVNGNLECYDSNIVPFAIALFGDIDENTSSFLETTIENDFSRIIVFIGPTISYMTEGIIKGKDFTPYISDKSIEITKMLDEQIWGNYASAYILDNEPNDNVFEFDWEIGD